MTPEIASFLAILSLRACDCAAPLSAAKGGSLSAPEHSERGIVLQLQLWIASCLAMTGRRVPRNDRLLKENVVLPSILSQGQRAGAGAKRSLEAHVLK